MLSQESAKRKNFFPDPQYIKKYILKKYLIISVGKNVLREHLLINGCFCYLSYMKKYKP